MASSPRSRDLTRIALVVSLIAACRGADADGPAASTSIDTINGIAHVRNTGAPETWRTVERLALGSAGMDAALEEQIFGRVSDVIADAQGNVYVADARALEVRVFDENGTFLRRFGTSGAGPGEFRALQSIAWLGDTLLALDPGNARLALLTSEGEWLGHRPYMALTGGSIRLRSAGLRDVYMPFIGTVGDQRGLVFVRQTPAGPADTLSATPSAPGSSTTSNEFAQRAQAFSVRCTLGSGGIGFHSAERAPQLLLLPAPDGLRVFAWSAQYRVALINADADTVRVVERDLPSGPLSDAEWQEEQQRYQEFLDQFDDEACEPRTLPRPPERRIIVGIVFDDAGRMWVERDAGTERALDVFAPDGRLLGTIDIPRHVDRLPPYVRDDRLYLVVTDSLDVEYVRVYDVLGS